jgi:hypothetical protein
MQTPTVIFALPASTTAICVNPQQSVPPASIILIYTIRHAWLFVLLDTLGSIAFARLAQATAKLVAAESIFA